MTFGHGYRLAKGLDMNGFMAALDEIRVRGDAIAADMVAKRLCQLMVELVDKGGLEPVAALVQARVDLLNTHLESKRTNRRYPNDDFECEISFTWHEERGYALVHAEQHEYHAMIASVPGFEQWPWYEAEKPPNDVRPEEWQDRRETWWAIAHRTERRMPLAFELLGQRLPTPDMIEVVAHLPSLEDRATRLAKDRLLPNRRTETFQDAIRVIDAHWSWLRTEEGMDAVSAMVPEIIADLTPIEAPQRES